MTPEEEIAGIERALDALLSHAVELDERPKGYQSKDAMTWSEIMANMPGSEAAYLARGLIENPVLEALRQAVRALGERLFELGGLALMTDALDRVAELNADQADYRSAIMDRRWDGIGRTSEQSGWAA